MHNNIDKGLEELEVEEVFDADALEKELNDILREDAVDSIDDYDEMERLLAEKNEARKKRSVLLARRRKRQLKTLSIGAAIASVVLTVVVIVVFVVVMKDATSSLGVHNTDILGATQGTDVNVDDTVSGNDVTGEETKVSGTEKEPETEDMSEVSTQAESESISQEQKETQRETEKESQRIPESTKATESVKPTQSVATPGKYVTITDSNVTAQYAALYDVSSGKLIAGKGPDVKMYPASMTKVMTLIVACENIVNWNEKTTLTESEASYLLIEDASRAGYASGEGDEAKDLIYGLILESGCDAAMMLARIACGSEAAFVEKMNAKCKELGLKHTHFTNSTGLHNNNQYTTVADMCKIMEYAMNNSQCAKILGTYKYTTTFIDGKKTKNWVHNNIETYNKTVYTSNTYAMQALNNKGITVTGVKSGYTLEAGNCLVTCVEKSGRRYIAVVGNVKGKGQSTINTTRILLNYLN
ncbi:MAG: D-alanyl-D-alanine carboxypeptidase [Lachnospira sp.]|nr:D-alanyl-D-alanine carboxypeptidase [Lachnospira sp.]